MLKKKKKVVISKQTENCLTNKRGIKHWILITILCELWYQKCYHIDYSFCTVPLRNIVSFSRLMKKQYQYFVVTLSNRKFHVKPVHNSTQAKQKRKKIINYNETRTRIFRGPQREKSSAYFIPNPKIFNPLSDPNTK